LAAKRTRARRRARVRRGAARGEVSMVWKIEN
jgi:hypothetical protein